MAYPASRMARNSATALAGVSNPTALPMRACLVGYAENTSTTRFADAGIARSRACLTANPATRAQRSGSATYEIRPSSSISLNEKGTVMMRPSNSGTATWVATSSGDSPPSLSCHCARELVRHRPCRIGMSSAARCQHGCDQRLDGADQVQQSGVGCPQRGAENRQRPTPGILDGAAQRLDVAGVACKMLGAVVEHRDCGAVEVASRPVEDAPARRGLRGHEAEPRH